MKKHESLMEYIEDKDVFKAVSFARKLYREGVPIGLAVYKASRYYHVDQTDVAHYMGQLGGNVNSIKQKRKRWH